MPKRRRYSLRKRHFLEPLPTEHNSYISTLINYSDAGNDPYGTNVIIIADCYRAVEIEFYLGNAAARKLSLYKINKMVKTMTEFRDTLRNEIEVIEKARKRR